MTPIEYFYSAHSGYAYLGSAKLQAIAEASGRPLLHRPFDLRKTVAAVSGTANGSRSEAHRRYFFRREIERWSEEREAPIISHYPSHHANDPELANRLLIAAQQAGHRIDGLAHALLEAHWRDDADLADRATLQSVTEAAGLDAEALMEAVETEAVQAAYEANTAEAIERAIFGSPTYFVDGDMFYGQDRLELVARAIVRPYAGQSYRP